MSRPFKRQALTATIVTALAFVSTASIAANVSGRITDSNEQVGFEGAKVTLVELNRKAVSDHSGQFRFSNLPSGEYTLRVEYVGAEPVEQSISVSEQNGNVGNILVGDDIRMLDNTLVIGMVAGQAAAINKQRNAENIVSVVSSDAIGQFPDQNTAEAVQRLPGVSITRDQGEGRYVVVRGIDPTLNSVSVQGVRIPSPERDDRSVQIDVVPSELLESLEVYKTLSADQDADNIGGRIEIKSLSAFDRDDFSARAKLEAQYNDLTDNWNPKGAATMTKTWQDANGQNVFGMAASISYQDRKFGSDNLENDGYGEFELPDGSEVLASEEQEHRDYLITRERQALTLNFDWNVNDTTALYLRTLHSDFSDDEVRNRNEFKLDKGDLIERNGDTYRYEDARIDKSLKLRKEEAVINSFSLGGDTYLDDWTFGYSYSYSSAKEDEANRIDAKFKGKKQFVRLEHASNRIPTLVAEDPSLLNDPSKYKLDEVEISNNFTKDKETALKLDVRRDLFFAENTGFVKFGYKGRSRDKDDDQNVTVYDDFGSEDVTLGCCNNHSVDYPLGHFGASINPAQMRQLVNSNRANWGVDADATRIESTAGDYQIEENINAFYLMGGIDINDLHIIGGVRVEDTEFNAQGYRVSVDETQDPELTVSPLTATKDYSDTLPSLSARWPMADGWQLRGAFSQSVVRPGFRQVAPFQIIEVEKDGDEVERKAEVGNPDLNPLRANNFDVMLEFYPGDIGMFTAGVFYKDIENFIVNADLAGTAQWEGFKEVIAPINGESAELWGAEIGLVRQMDFLPGIWNGLLISANATFTDSEATIAGRSEKIPLPLQSNFVGNLSIGYEKGPLNVRLSGSWRDERFMELGKEEDGSLDIWEDSHFQVDFSARYRINNQWRVYFDATNLNDAPYFTYVGSRSRPGQYEEYGPTYALGVRFDY